MFIVAFTIIYCSHVKLGTFQIEQDNFLTRIYTFQIQMDTFVTTLYTSRIKQTTFLTKRYTFQVEMDILLRKLKKPEPLSALNELPHITLETVKKLEQIFVQGKFSVIPNFSLLETSAW